MSEGSGGGEVRGSVAPAVLPDEYAVLARTPGSTGGHDFAQLMAIVAGESAFKHGAHNHRTDAEGPFQFVRGTWLSLMKEHGVAFGVKPELVAAISRDAKGKPHIADRATLKTLLDLRHDLPLASRMAAAYLDENAGLLHRMLGRRPSDPEVQLSFLLGARGAARMIHAAAKTPDRPAEEIAPHAAAANRHLFFAAGGRPRSARETLAYLDGRYETQKAKYAAYARLAVSGSALDVNI